VKLAARIGLVGAAVVAAGWLVDYDALAESLRRLSGQTVALFLLLMLGYRLVYGYRWSLVARDQCDLRSISWIALTRINLVGEFAMMFLPTAVAGEGTRVWLLAREIGDARGATKALVVDRLVGLLSLVLSSIVAILAVVLISPESMTVPPGFAVAVLAGLGVALVALPFVVRRLGRVVSRFREMARAAEGVQFLSLPLLVSIASQVFPAAACALVLGELASQGVLLATFVAVVSRLGRTIPISALGVSGVEGGIVVTGLLVGIPEEPLLVVSGLNVASKYVAALLGVTWQVSRGGWPFKSG
jgi:hypothetical protein